MKAVVQRVVAAKVEIDGKVRGSIGQGLMVLLGVSVEDTEEEAVFLARKIANLRIFEDAQGKMNLSLLDMGGEMLVVSNFTLCANSRKGNRPSFIAAARPEQANPLYELFLSCARDCGVPKVESGVFGAEMQVEIHNDGPITLILDTDEIMARGS